jgi:predicted permease
MATLTQDVRYAARLLRRSPGFTAMAALTIALGIGPTTTIFSVANSLLIRTPPGVRDPGTLVSVYVSHAEGSRFGTFSFNTFEALRDGPNGLDDIAALDVFSGSLSTGGDSEPEMIGGLMVSAEYFSILGTRPALGRFFLAEEDDVPNAGAVVVLSHRLWSRRFAADSALIGKTVVLNRHTFTVIGIAEEGFQGHTVAYDFGLWVPLSMRESVSSFTLDNNSTGLVGIARLAPATSSMQAREAMSITAARLRSEDPEGFENADVTVAPFSAMIDEARGPVTIFMAVLLVVSGMVLLIASVNVASMFLARATIRGREIAVRLAIGAGRTRLIRQLTTESVMLFLLGGAAGTVFTFWATGALAAIRPPIPFPIKLDFAPDLRVLGFTLALALVTGVLFGLAPAFQATQQDIASTLKGERAESPGRGKRMRNAFVVAQVAGSVVLLIGAGMFLRALARADSVDLGFEPQNIHVLTADVALHRYSDEEELTFFRELQDRAASLPGVESSGLTTALPLGFIRIYQTFEIPGREPVMGDGIHQADVNSVSPGYFATMGIDIVAGRAFDSRDRQGSPPVVVINQTAATRIWPGESALGKQLSDYGQTYEVVGIARDGKYGSIGEEGRSMVYKAFAQRWSSNASLVVRTAPGAPRIDRQVRDIALALDPDLPVQTNAPYQQIIGVSLIPNQAAAGITGALGFVGMILAAVGLFGVLSYAVSRRTREIGIRIALGAGTRDVHRLVLREGVRLTSIGLAIGCSLAFAAAHLIRGLLYGVSPADPVTFGGIAVLLILVGILASYLPASRATNTDPMDALRAE